MIQVICFSPGEWAGDTRQLCADLQRSLGRAGRCSGCWRTYRGKYIKHVEHIDADTLTLMSLICWTYTDRVRYVAIFELQMLTPLSYIMKILLLNLWNRMLNL